MRTKVDALYDLAKKVNGEASRDDTIVEMIDKITNGYNGGGGSGGTGKNILKINSQFPVSQNDEPLVIEDGEDIEALEKLYTDFNADVNAYPDAVLFAPDEDTNYIYTVSKVIMEYGQFFYVNKRRNWLRFGLSF